MITSYGINLIKQFEGLSLKAYKCPAGVWTIGYGNTYYADGTKVKEGDLITKEDAENLLRFVATEFSKKVAKLITAPLNMYQFDAVCSFAYNVGLGALEKSTLLKLVNKNPNDLAIGLEFAKWNKAGGRVLTGLTKRRKAESDLYFTK